jgi:hypothetical protein
MQGLGVASAIALGISQVAYLGAMVTLGVRLVALARRTKQVPEALLAAHFLLSCTLGYILQGSGHALAMEPGASRPLVATILATGHAASVLGVGSVVVFNYLVFRRGTLLGRTLVVIGIGMLVTGYAGYGASGGFWHGRPSGFWFWLLYAGFTAVSVWTLVEPLLYYVALRKRLRLGLADPLVVDRLLLWGIGSLARFAMLAVGAYSMLHLTGDVSELAAIAAPTLFASGIAGLIVAICYGLAFFPPRAYRQAVLRRSLKFAGLE